jgi:hypothetical protein
MFSRSYSTFRPGNGNNDKYFLTIGAAIVYYFSSKRPGPPNSAGDLMLIP